MPRSPASITQADIARAIRAAKKSGAAEVEVRIGDATIVVRIAPSTNADKQLESEGEVVL
jgi:hypothetical protein